jgi:hypothetical protein
MKILIKWAKNSSKAKKAIAILLTSRYLILFLTARGLAGRFGGFYLRGICLKTMSFEGDGL